MHHDLKTEYQGRAKHKMLMAVGSRADSRMRTGFLWRRSEWRTKMASGSPVQPVVAVGGILKVGVGRRPKSAVSHGLCFPKGANVEGMRRTPNRSSSWIKNEPGTRWALIVADKQLTKQTRRPRKDWRYAKADFGEVVEGDDEPRKHVAGREG